MVSLINPGIKYKLNKLLSDECYSSAKLEALGFESIYLKDGLFDEIRNIVENTKIE